MNKSISRFVRFLILIGSLILVAGFFITRVVKESVQGDVLPEKAEYIPQIDRIGIPGKPYAYASVFYSAPIYALESSKEEPDYRLRDPLQEGFGPRLFPAHQADLKVALWHQVLPNSRTPRDFMVKETFVFYNAKDEVVAFFHVDYRNKMIWIESDEYVYLDSPSTTRLSRIHKELKGLE